MNRDATTLRILCTGSRTWTDRQAIADQFAFVAAQNRPSAITIPYANWLVVHGDCPEGADRLVEDWCQANGVPTEKHPYRSQDGRRGGLTRNTFMVTLGADLCLVFLGPCGKMGCRRGPHPHPSHGTYDCMMKAIQADIETYILRRGV